MKITIKTLTGQKFEVDVEGSDTVLDVKEKFAAANAEAEVARQKLIFAGKVLADDSTVEAAGVKEGDFLVCMLSRAKKPVAAAPAPAAAAPAPAAAAAAAPAPAAAASSSAAAEAPAAASASASPASAAPAAPAAAAFAAKPEDVENLKAMGFPEPEVRAALRAAFGNPDRAVEYLMTGIPEGLAAPPAPAAPAAAAAASSSDAAAASGAAASGSDPLARLRAHPQINQLKRLVQSNPSALPMVLQQIGAASPALLELINANREAFVALMNEPIDESAAAAATGASGAAGAAGATGGPSMPGLPPGVNPQMMAAMVAALPAEERARMAESMGITPEQLTAVTSMMASGAIPTGAGEEGGEGGAPPGTTVIRLTEDESAAVERMIGMGFERNQVIEAYLACDKNEELALNYLLENMN